MKSYKHTICASYFGYITQAIVNNFAPLLFVMFSVVYGISLDKITLLVTFNFGIQFAVDLLAAKFIDRVNCRAAAVTAHLCAAMGISGLGFLPDIMPEPLFGIFISVGLYAVGGGLIEVLISPIVEACPTDKKSAAMSLLHSFYCWGHVAVVLISTAFFAVFGMDDWRILSGIWAIIPLANAIYFLKVPLYPIAAEEKGEKLSTGLGVFFLFMALMFCSGASEQAMSQWASSFAETALGVEKAVGDLAGPCMFAVLMGTARVIYPILSDRVSIKKFIALSSLLCIASYITAALSQNAVLSLAACALCGLSVGILWPGTFSMAAARFPGVGASMFALLALAGDLGCMGGPTAAGLVSSAAGSMKAGFGAAALFPAAMLIVLLILRRQKN